jgi:hypothetical protein
MQSRFEAAALLSALKSQSVSDVALVPTMLRKILALAVR